MVAFAEKMYSLRKAEDIEKDIPDTGIQGPSSYVSGIATRWQGGETENRLEQEQIETRLSTLTMQTQVDIGDLVAKLEGVVADDFGKERSIRETVTKVWTDIQKESARFPDDKELKLWTPNAIETELREAGEFWFRGNGYYLRVPETEEALRESAA